MIPWQTCAVCGSAPARVCRSCVRTIADRDFAAIGLAAWRREGGCVVCEGGAAHACGTCAIAEIDEARRTS